jgi:tetratricopeptide (TPR) repeat protein
MRSVACQTRPSDLEGLNAVDNEFEGFQQSIQGGGGGLAWKQPKYQAGAGLQINTDVDLSKLGAFGAKKINVSQLVDIPAAGGGLHTKMDFGELGEGIRKIKAKEKSDRVRVLLDEAEQLINKKEFKKALPVLDKALAIEPGSSQILLTKAYALFGMEDYPGAVLVIRKIRSHAPNADSQVMAVFLEAACIRAITERVVVKLAELVKAGKTTDALSYLDTQIREYPENPGLIYQRCQLLMLLDRFDQAKSAAQAAVRSFPAGASMFQQILSEIKIAESAGILESARGALRRNDPTGAVAEVERCRATMSGEEQFEAIRSYADSVVPRGFISSIVRRDRPLPVDPQTLQRVLLWVLAEEIDGGVKALNAKDYERAVQFFESSYRIDARCYLIPYLHAVAIVREFEKLLQAQTPVDVEEWARKMHDAEVFVASGAQDRNLLDQCRGLNAVVKRYSVELNQLLQVQQRQLMEVKPVNDLFEEFNTFINRLKVTNRSDLLKAEKRLTEIRAKAQSALQRISSRDGKKHLNDLIGAIDGHLGEIAKVK